MKHVCAALLSVLLAGFSPEQGQNDLLCTSVDTQTGESVALTTRFTRINDLFLVIGEVRLAGQFEGQTINRTFAASDFQMNTQIDRDGQRRLAFHSRNGVNDRLKWFIRDGAGIDAFSFDLPAKLGLSKVSGRFAGEFTATATGAAKSPRTAECSSSRVVKY